MRATIVGIATGTPDGGVAVLRLSGPAARAVAERVITGELPPPRLLLRRSLRLASSQEEALVVVMPAPRSFTGEDVVEVHVHGGRGNVQEVMAALLAAGATAAGPGEFTRRAFEHGRLGLEQAEGLAALIGAQTAAAAAQARRLVAGELGRRIDAICEAIGELRAEVEANLDFSEEEERIAEDLPRWQVTILGFLEELGGWLRRFESGRRAREAARVVLAGPPNAGKSSLFNALLGHERAIVAPLPGTTRDYVEARVAIGEYEAVLVDTAGLRAEEVDLVEAAGIVRSREQVAGADVVIWVEGADAPPARERPALHGLVIEVENKRDLGESRPGWLGVCSSSGDGLDGVVEAIRRWFVGDGEEPWIGLARHYERASEAVTALTTAARELEAAAPLEIVAFQLAVGERRLAEIRGLSAAGPVGEEVLARIFARFCIGK